MSQFVCPGDGCEVPGQPGHPADNVPNAHCKLTGKIAVYGNVVCVRRTGNCNEWSYEST